MSETPECKWSEHIWRLCRAGKRCLVCGLVVTLDTLPWRWLELLEAIRKKEAAEWRR